MCVVRKCEGGEEGERGKGVKGKCATTRDTWTRKRGCAGGGRSVEEEEEEQGLRMRGCRKEVERGGERMGGGEERDSRELTDFISATENSLSPWTGPSLPTKHYHYLGFEGWRGGGRQVPGC